MAVGQYLGSSCSVGLHAKQGQLLSILNIISVEGRVPRSVSCQIKIYVLVGSLFYIALHRE